VSSQYLVHITSNVREVLISQDFQEVRVLYAAHDICSADAIVSTDKISLE
jgi:hypothetical protein